jgi:hypothetical protein
MAILVENVKRTGVNFLATPYSCDESSFAIGETTIFFRDNAGILRSWQNGRAAEFNNLPNGGDDIPPYATFEVLPTTQIETDDTKLSFQTPIQTSGGTTTFVNSNNLLM